jgi:5-methylcytosine-specific restriction enzyme subunit McrC
LITVPFHDLVGPDRELTAVEDRWLADLAADTDPTDLVVNLGRSVIGAEPGPIVTREISGWRAGRYIGEIRRDGITLEIQPRLDLAVIAAWASTILNVRVIPHSAEHAGGTRALIAELVAGAWRNSLVDAARHGPPGFRTPTSHQGAHVKGRLDLPGTIPLRAAGRPDVRSISRPKLANNPVTRAIVLADHALDRWIARPGWRGDRVDELMPRLRAAVGPRPAAPTARELATVRYTPITVGYRRTADLSFQILRNRGLRATATAEKTDGVLLDVAELWELFLVHCAKRAFGAANVIHGTRMMTASPLLRSTLNDRVLGRLYPDILIGSIEKPVALIDAKYKPLHDARGVDRDDLYQLAAYLTGYQTDPKPTGALAYTTFPTTALQPSSADEVGSPWRTPAGNLMCFARMPVDERECVAAIRLVAETAAPRPRDGRSDALPVTA